MATFTGDSGSNTIVGLAEDDTINGLGGADSLSGLGGNDLINGDGGADTLQGGEGSDMIFGGGGNDTVIHVFGDNVGTSNEYDGGNNTDTLRLELTSAELIDLINDLRALSAQLESFPGTQYSFNAVDLVVEDFETLEIVVDGVVIAADDLPHVANDAITVIESEAGGDVDVNVLTNDAVTPVAEVDGAAGNVGLEVAGSAGGLFTINADGTTDFNANGDFESLGIGESATTSVTYGAEVQGVQGKYDIILTQDLSGSFSDDLPNVRAAFDGLFDDLTADGDDVGFGVASFVDKPISPFGNAGAGDFAYATDQAVSTDKATTQATLDSLFTRSGSDSDESQLIALQQIALRATSEIGFRADAQRFIVLQTDADPHVAGDFSAANPDDGDTDTTETEDYPTVASVGALLNAANISVIFAISPQQTSIAAYETLLADLGVNGTVVTLSSDSSNLATAIQNGLNTFTSVETATLTATVTGENDAADAVDDVATILEDAGATLIDLTGNDSDPDASDDLEILSVDTTGTVGTVIVNGDNDTVNYDPAGNFDNLAVGETAIDTFTYTVTDGNGSTDTATVSITIEGENDLPVAVADTASAGEDDAAPTNIDLTGNDSDPDGSDDLEILSIDTTGTLGTVVVNSDNDSVDYDPNGAFESLGEGETAIDTFTYTVTDGNGGTDTETVSVTVTGANDLPVAAADSASVGEDDSAPTQIDVLANDSDPDLSDDLEILSVDTTGMLGTVSVNDNGTPGDPTDDVIDYNPAGAFESLADGETAIDTFTYTVTDGNGGTDTETVSVTVTGANDAPDAVDDTGGVTVGGSVTIDALANDSDPDLSDVVSITDLGTPTRGTASIVGGDVVFDAGSDFDFLTAGETAVETISYTVSDGNGETDTASITVMVTGNNTPPEANADTTLVAQGGTVDIDVLGNDTDIDGDTLTVIDVSDPANGTTSINADGTINFVPDFTFFGDETITYTVSDGRGGTATADVTVTVIDNLPPFIPEPVVFTVPETINIVPGQDAFAADLQAIDPEGDQASIRFAIAGGDDGDLFTIDEVTGEIRFENAPDFEAPADANADNIYLVDITVSDAFGSNTQNIEITVTDDVADNPVNPPDIVFPLPPIEFDPVRQFISSASVGVLTDVDAVDPDIPNGDSIQFSLFGEDASEFSIDAATGEIILATPLTDPFGSFDGDAIYEVIVLVEDENGFSDVQEIEYLLFVGG